MQADDGQVARVRALERVETGPGARAQERTGGVGAVARDEHRLDERTTGRIPVAQAIVPRIALLQEQPVREAVAQERPARTDRPLGRRVGETIVRVVAARAAHVDDPRVRARREHRPTRRRGTLLHVQVHVSRVQHRRVRRVQERDQ